MDSIICVKIAIIYLQKTKLKAMEIFQTTKPQKWQKKFLAGNYSYHFILYLLTLLIIVVCETPKILAVFLMLLFLVKAFKITSFS